MKSIFRQSYILLGLFFLSFFAYGQSMPSTPIYSDPGTVITVSSGSPVFTITQPANPTTGYSWSIKNYDSSLLKLIAVDYRGFSTSAQMPGSGGNEVFVFQAQPQAFTTQGSTQITLVYARSFAPQDNPKTVVFNVMFSK